ncbi:hypothetical protein Syun_029977 [Stephania yunnanensis]|uniref:Uncharacterized protein n=1 Tax=Stephania yunnanensis TaxID=152371 RepID=A0AAP0HGI5_9MAGN
MRCEFGNTRHRDDGVVKLGEVEVRKVNHFIYLGSIIQNDGNIVNDVTQNSSWMEEMAECNRGDL